MSTLGHNNGPSMQSGLSWRKHCWKRARADLMPHLPIEILRRRVKRARELGLEYKTYASVRAATGHDVVGFLFSTNALRALKNNPGIPADRLAKLATLQDCHRIALVTPPLTAAQLLRANPGAAISCAAAPPAHASWSAAGLSIRAALHPQKIPSDTMLLIGDTTLEAEWSTAGRLAGYLSAARYFAAAAP